jgi:hypothetical protein
MGRDLSNAGRMNPLPLCRGGRASRTVCRCPGARRWRPRGGSGCWCRAVPDLRVTPYAGAIWRCAFATSVRAVRMPHGHCTAKLFRGHQRVAGALRLDQRVVSVRERRLAEDPPPPAVLGHGPAPLLNLQPRPRRPTGVRARLVLGHVALVAPRPPNATPPRRPAPAAAPGTPTRCRRRRLRARRSLSGRPVKSRPSQYSRSKAMYSGGVATASGSGSRIQSNRDRSCWS